eukprot:m.116928 g.116928  ORF g.116928 m.116928 type:complete len:443 (+) comp21662_c1_seq2:15-1343(+)
MPPVNPTGFRVINDTKKRYHTPPTAPRKKALSPLPRRTPESTASPGAVPRRAHAIRAKKPKGVIFTSNYLGGDFSIGTSRESRWQTAAVLSFLMLLPLAAYCSSMTFLFLIFPLTTLQTLAYLWFIWVYDQTPVNGDRTPFLRRSCWWNHLCDYFPITLVKTTELSPDRSYIFGYHPHGIISHGAFGAFATEGAAVVDLTDPTTPDAPVAETDGGVQRRGFSSLFPGVDVRLLTLPINFYVPVCRELLLWLGICSAERETFQKILCDRQPRSIALVVGGADEAVLAAPGTMQLYLERRKGFIREAVAAGASLVPVLAFGENDVYDTTQLHGVLRWIQETATHFFTFSMPIFHGRGVFFKDGFGFVPHRRSIVVVVGAPIAPPLIVGFDPRKYPAHRAAVDELHRRYVAALIELYDAHKDAQWNDAGLRRLKTGSGGIGLVSS